ncbi:MAG TPA: AAA family ATPase [Puia sp.]|nr:AAA family ATPase [Puia sp.]
MELKYIWIKDYGVINRLGVNFNHSGRHRFAFDGRKLHLLPNEASPLDFGPFISGLTAIAGQNGSGKSSLCQAVLSTTATVGENIFGYNSLFEGIVCYSDSIFRHKDLVFENEEEIADAGYAIVSFEESPFETVGMVDRSQYSKDAFVYYSHQFDVRHYFSEINLKNISTEGLLYDDHKYGSSYWFQEGADQGSIDTSHRLHSNTTIFRIAEGNRIVKFLVNKPSFIPFKGPPAFIIKSTFSFNNRWFNRWAEMVSANDDLWSLSQIEAEILSFVFSFDQRYDHDTEVAIDDVDFRHAIHYLFKFNIVRILAALLHPIPAVGDVYSFVFEENVAISFGPLNNIIQELVACHKALLGAGKLLEGKFKPFFLRTDHRSVFDDWRFYLIENIYLPNNPETAALLKNFMDLEHRLVSGAENPYYRISNFSFSSVLSSGEYSFLALFSRLFDVLSEFRAEGQERENIILFLDEAEVGYHPAWKKSLLKWLLEFLSDHAGAARFQVILTTHSPYLLSDLAPQNILLFRKNHEGHTEIVPPDTFATFGGNIFDLLADSFFLHDGTIGDFAKGIIGNVIGRLNKWRPAAANIPENERAQYLADKEHVYNIINIIADDIVRNKLLEMYYDTFGIADARSNEIQVLEQRLQRLKDQQHDMH